MYGRKYQWIIWGGYNKDWWLVDDAEVNCTTQELVTALNGYMSTDILPLSLENQETIAKLVGCCDFLFWKALIYSAKR